jgi:hypothetical protein
VDDIKRLVIVLRTQTLDDVNPQGPQGPRSLVHLDGVTAQILISVRSVNEEYAHFLLAGHQLFDVLPLTRCGD